MKSVTDIDGVYAGATACGIKSEGLDLAFLYVPNAQACAGVFTRNAFRGACLEHTKACLEAGSVKAVVINSGNSNVATGPKGIEDVERTAERAAKLLGLSASQIAVASTGIIGVPLPIEKIEAGLDLLLQDSKQKKGDEASDAILTTDLIRKETFLSSSIDGRDVVVAGFAKGSGMIAPNMGTMLAYLVINVDVPQDVLQSMLDQAVDASFNMVSVDTDTSTSDMALVFSSPENSISLENEENRVQLQSLLTEACVELAKLIAKDGEGAEKLLEVKVKGAASLTDARRASLSIAGSPLVKTAVHGADPNWGRVIMALGKTPNIEVEPSKVKLSFGNYLVFSDGEPVPGISLTEVAKSLQTKEVQVTIDLGLGESVATAWGCDLTKKYIDINVDYN